MTLHISLKEILKTTAAHIKKLDKMGLCTARDLLEYFPRTTESTEVFSQLTAITLGQKNTLSGILTDFRTEKSHRRGKKLGKAALILDDGTTIEVIWFVIPYILKNLRPDSRVYLVGKVDRRYGRLQILNPEVHINRDVHIGRLRAVYSESSPITSKWLREKMAGLLPLVGDFKEFLPSSILESRGYMKKSEAVKTIHAPKDSESWHAARERLAFEEVFEIQIRILREKLLRDQQSKNNYMVPFDVESLKEDLMTLPFELTLAQKKVLYQILKDFEKERPAHRLVQGDVGSGKTIVAFLAAAQMIRKGFQVTILAPTEILAEQHFQGALKFFEKLPEFSSSPTLLRDTLPQPLPMGGEIQVNSKMPEEIYKRLRDLREGQTVAEKFFWELVRDKRFVGLKFRRQHHLSPYILDFYCHEKKIAIELDGGYHLDAEQKRLDRERDLDLEAQGIVTKRFSNQEVLENPEKVLQTIYNFLYPETSLPSGGIEGGQTTKIELLTGSTSAKNKRIIKERLRTGDIKVLIGTHAVLTKDTVFKNLGLAVVDEQHRFGVVQRSVLLENGSHQLAMTATPIPRTLALTIYGDQDISIIDELPPGRKPIITKVVSRPDARQKMEIFTDDQIGKGRQVFWVCPLVDESDKIEAKNVHDEYERISQVFHTRKVTFLHGRMKSKEKESIMAAFKNQEFDILVSTSVIEVGVDIPNATVMVIENAERFGLAQLHQFRGRIGRNDMQSYCLLMTGSSDDAEKAQKRTLRLSAMEKFSSGQKLSEIDLKLRGMGELYGTKQSGLPDFKCADLSNLQMLQDARDWAVKILEEDVMLDKYPRLKNRVESAEVYF